MELEPEVDPEVEVLARVEKGRVGPYSARVLAQQVLAELREHDPQILDGWQFHSVLYAAVAQVAQEVAEATGVYHPVVDELGRAVRDALMVALLGELAELNAALDHSPDTIGDTGQWQRRNELVRLAWWAAEERAHNPYVPRNQAQGWRVGRDIDETDPRPYVAVIVTPVGQVRAHVPTGLLPTRWMAEFVEVTPGRESPETVDVPVIPWVAGSPSSAEVITAWLADQGSAIPGISGDGSGYGEGEPC